MNLKQLEYVVEISRSGSINKAAQNLYLAQPSLSASVRQLEQELGFSIFRRKNSGIELTSEGKLMLLSAKLIMEEVDRIRRIPTLFDSQRNLSISGTWSSLLMCSFMQFRNDEPEEHIQDNFKETSFQQAVHDVMDQIYRLSIVSCLNSRLELHRLELQKHHICMEPLAVDVPAAAVFSKDHYLSRFKRVTIEQLKRCSVVTYDIRSNDDWLGAFGLESGEDVLNIFDRGGMLDAIRHNYVAVTTWDPELEASLPNTVMREITDAEEGLWERIAALFGVDAADAAQYVPVLQDATLGELTTTDDIAMYKTFIGGFFCEKEPFGRKACEKCAIEAKALAPLFVVQNRPNLHLAFSIILYTACDLGNDKVHANEHLNPRARQNVVFEHGYMCALLGRQNVCALVEPDVEIPGDLSGIVYVAFDDKGAWQMSVAKEMKAAGLDVDLNKLV